MKQLRYFTTTFKNAFLSHDGTGEWCALTQRLPDGGTLISGNGQLISVVEEDVALGRREEITREQAYALIGQQVAEQCDPRCVPAVVSESIRPAA